MSRSSSVTLLFYARKLAFQYHFLTISYYLDITDVYFVFFVCVCVHKVALLNSDYYTTTLALPHRNAAIPLFLSRTRLAMLLSRS